MSNLNPTYQLGTTPWAELPTVTRYDTNAAVTTLLGGESITLVHEDAAGTVVATYTAAGGAITHTTIGTWRCRITTPSIGKHQLHWTAVIGGGTWEWHDTFSVRDSA